MWASLHWWMLFSVCLMLTYSSHALGSSLSSSCQLQRHFDIYRMHKEGDVVLGGVFYLRYASSNSDLSFTSEPLGRVCSGFYLLGYRHAQTMAFATDEINRNPNLLPNVTLGYLIYDNCIGYQSALSLFSGVEEQMTLDGSCVGSPPVLGIVGDASSSNSIAISNILGLYSVPTVSYFATCSCLGDRKRFPSFFRTIPSDNFQVRAMIEILKHFGWTWVGLLVTNSDYGLNAARSFESDLALTGAGCLAYSELLPSEDNHSGYRRIVDLVRISTARVVIVFSYGQEVLMLMKEVERQKVMGIQWMASEAWAASSWLADALFTPEFLPYVGGTLGFAIHHGEIPGFKEFLLDMHPHDSGDTEDLVKPFWEKVFQCRFSPPSAGQGDEGVALCTGHEDLRNVEDEFFDVSQLRSEYNVYKAVYSLAYALHDMLHCEPGRGPFNGDSCADRHKLEPWQLLYYMEKVNFTTSSGDRVYFEENGDALPIYDVMNWAWLPDGSAKVQVVGVVEESASGKELVLDEDKIFWNFKSGKRPRSVCSESCPPGTRKARKKGLPECCFDCVPCSEGKISKYNDSVECSVCPEDFWSNPERDNCLPKQIEFLSYHEPLGICLTTVSLLGTFICATVLGVFVQHRRTPMVRANNSELSFLLLLSLKLCFLCSLLFIGRPQLLTCQLRHAAFGISFVLCVSCILVKTMVVLAVFKASKPGGRAALKWFGVSHQRGTVLFFTSIQAVICVIWLVSSPPTPHKDTKYYNDKIVYECIVGSTVGFGVLLGYIGLLAVLSFLLAFMSRNLPDNFNEAKLITFSMLIFCVVWVAFVPAYINSPGKYADSVEVFAILASSFGLLTALFAPKCYIILVRPERNTKKAIMGRGTTAGTCTSASVTF